MAIVLHIICLNDMLSVQTKILKMREILGLETYGNVNPSLSYVENKTNTLILRNLS